MNALEHVQAALRDRRRNGVRYRVPDLWVEPSSASLGVHTVDPFDFFLERIAHIRSQPAIPLVTGPDDDWSRRAVVYNLFVRLATAWDHDGNGRLDLPSNAAGWRETGTFLKSIALLPYVQALGCNTIHLLPITSIGRDGRKGTLGSPYAIRNHYTLDENLAEPALGLGAETEFAAFVEAAHHLGMRVVIEFVLRTAAKDADWAADHPEWFYWIRADVEDRPAHTFDEERYGQPIFTSEEREYIERKFAAKDTTELLEPHSVHREMFTPPPPAETVHKDEQDRWIGVLPDGTRVRIPGAFTDWPLGGDQPPWTDVTYLRLYDHPEFNYIAYNTLRLYDARLTHPQYRVEALWERIVGVLPHYQRTFGVDGVMLDMGHALPPALKRRILEAARDVDPDFAVWAEDFDLDATASATLYNAVMGPLSIGLFFVGSDGLRPIVDALDTGGVQVQNLLAPETHNTRRAASHPGGTQFSRSTLAVSAILPGIIWIHNGLELGDRRPVNTGVGFDEEEWRRCGPDVLPLFSAEALDWTNRCRLPDVVLRLLAFRRQHLDLLDDTSSDTVETTRVGLVWHVVRKQPDGDTAVVLIKNGSPAVPQPVDLRLPTASRRLYDVISDEDIGLATDGRLQTTLEPGAALLFELPLDGSGD